ncbi:MAG: sterol desaturase family protein [Actinomycetota bacterium]
MTTSPVTATTDTAPDTLAGGARMFARYPSPRILAVSLVALATARAVLGGWRWWDLVVAAALVGSQPFVEWSIHVHLLHFRPRTIKGRRVDLFLARKHRAHHADPRRIGLLFIPTAGLPVFAVLWTAIFAATTRDLRLGLTGGVTVAALTLVYEWMHFLPHIRYRPHTKLLRAPWRAHRLHHYKNEQYWNGICTTFADHLLGTFPDKDAVETSPTCRNLDAAYEG